MTESRGLLRPSTRIAGADTELASRGRSRHRLGRAQSRPIRSGHSRVGPARLGDRSGSSLALRSASTRRGGGRSAGRRSAGGQGRGHRGRGHRHHDPGRHPRGVGGDRRRRQASLRPGLRPVRRRERRPRQGRRPCTGWPRSPSRITAAAVLKLAEDGKLDLDAPIQRYVRLPSREKAWPVTARQLLGHLGGVRHYRDDEPTNTKPVRRRRERPRLLQGRPARGRARDAVRLLDLRLQPAGGRHRRRRRATLPRVPARGRLRPRGHDRDPRRRGAAHHPEPRPGLHAHRERATS